jgi:methionyl-tRNA synthetase
MSKSLGNVIDPRDMIAKYGLDQVRYFLLREVPFGQDGDFSQAAIVRRINSDLANDLGNLAQRVLSFIAKNCDGRMPQPGEINSADDELLEESYPLDGEVRHRLIVQEFHLALTRIWDLVNAANVYVDSQAPWSLRKTDPPRMNTVLFVLAEVLRRIGILIQPFMPESAAKLLDQLAVPANERQMAHIVDDKPGVTPGAALPAPQGIFPRYVTDGNPSVPKSRGG